MFVGLVGSAFILPCGRTTAKDGVSPSSAVASDSAEDVIEPSLTVDGPGSSMSSSDARVR